MKRIAIAFYLAFGTTANAGTSFDSLPNYSITAISDMPVLMKNLSTPSSAPCKAALNDLVMVKVRYWGFDDQAHSGSLIVHKSLGPEVVAIFKELLVMRFPIQAMLPVPQPLRRIPNIYENITGSFSCRAVTDQPEIMSQHSYGRAIDINPMINPYIKGCLIEPPSGRKYIDRIKPEKGKIIPNTAITAIFAKYGWDWGGNWYDAQDYQHIEKRANNEKRDPFGYVTPRFRYNSIIDICKEKK